MIEQPLSPIARTGTSHKTGTTGQPFSMRERLMALDHDISVAIVGAGAMGRGLLYQCKVTPGFRCLALADVRPERAVACAEALGVSYRIVSDLSDLHDAIRDGHLAISEDAELVARAEPVDVFIDASNAILEAGRFCATALEHGKHLVMMNAEADLVFGPYFMAQAESRGVTYASCDGDQHGVIKRLVDDLTLWGFDLVMAGNMKGFLNRYADPTSIIPEADKRNLDYQMCTAYTDGTKLAIEMALVANALGLKTAVPGMYGPRASHVRDVLQLFDFDDIRSNHGAVVDYVLGSEPNGGVYAVGFCDDAYQQQMMAYYKMGDGPYYVFYRPYHLCHVEAMDAIAAGYLDHSSLLQPRYGLRTDVYAYAKRDLRKGDRLDGIGGYACYGLLENRVPDGNDGVPICLADDVRIKVDLAKDEKVLLEHLEYAPDRLDFALYGKSLAAS